MVFREPPPPPLKVRSFSETQKYLNFSSLIPFYLLKVTKFLGNISQFEFLVMTEENIFVYKLFLSLIYFFCENCNPPLKKVTPHSKIWGPVKPPLFENLVSGSTLFQRIENVRNLQWLPHKYVPISQTENCFKNNLVPFLEEPMSFLLALTVKIKPLNKCFSILRQKLTRILS